MTWFYLLLSAIEYLKIIVGADAEDSKEGARKRLVWFPVNPDSTQILIFHFLPHGDCCVPCPLTSNHKQNDLRGSKKLCNIGIAVIS